MQHTKSSNATTTTTILGRAAEAVALAHLEAAGLRCIARNHRCRGGEIDLVMLDETTGVLALVEVRSRSRADYGSAAATIGAIKRRRLTLAARHLLLTQPSLRSHPVRFDVVAIDPPAAPGEPSRVTWIRHAFDVPP
jgi:putative endonuclease